MCIRDRSDPRTNYGYVLVDKDTNEILKFGETLYPETRSVSYTHLDVYKRQIVPGSSALLVCVKAIWHWMLPMGY